MPTPAGSGIPNISAPDIGVLMTFPWLPHGCRWVQSQAGSVLQEEKAENRPRAPQRVLTSPQILTRCSLPFLTRPQCSALSPHPDNPPPDTRERGGGGDKDTLTNANRKFWIRPPTHFPSSPAPSDPPSSRSFLLAVGPFPPPLVQN